MRILPSLLLLPLLVACSSAATDDDDATTADQAINGTMVQVLASELHPSVPVQVDYTSSPRFRGARILLSGSQAGTQPISVEPVGATGDAAMWITDSTFQNLAIVRPKGSRSASTTFDFEPSKMYYVVFRDEGMHPATFRVTLGVAPHLVNEDPDEGDPLEQAPDANLVGHPATGTVEVHDTSTTYDYQGQVAMSSTMGGQLAATAKLTAARHLHVTTMANAHNTGRILHAFTVSSDAANPGEGPLSVDWDVNLAPVTTNGPISGKTTIGNIELTATVSGRSIALSFAGKIRSGWNGNSIEHTIGAGTTLAVP